MWPFLSRPSFLPGQNGDRRRESSTSTDNNVTETHANKEPEEIDYFYLDGFFSENPPDKFACPICLCPVQREAYLTECCGRHFCRECITRLVGSKPCPMCKSSPLAIFPNKERQREINALAVCCPVSLVDSKDGSGENGQKSQEEAAKDSSGEENGTNEGETGTKCSVCDWKGELGQLEAHLKAKHEDDRRWRVAEKAPAETRNRVPLTRSMEEFMDDWNGLFVPRLRPRIRRVERNLGGSLRLLSRNNPWSQESGWDSDDSDTSDDGEPASNSVLSPSGRVLHPYFTVPDTSYSVLHPVERPGGLSPALQHPYHHRDLAAATQVESQLESSLSQLNLATEYSNAPNLSNESNSSDRPGAVGETLSEGRGVVGISGPHPIGRSSNESSLGRGNRLPQVGGRPSERDSNNHSYAGTRILTALDYRPPTPHSNYSEFPQPDPHNRMSQPRQRHHFVHHSFGPFHSPPRPPSVRPRPPPPPHLHRHPCPHQHHHGREFNHIPPPSVFQENRQSQIPPRSPSPEFIPPPILPPPVSPPNLHHRWRTISPTDFEPYGSRQPESSRHSAFVNPFQPPIHSQNCPLRSRTSQQHQQPSHPQQRPSHPLQRGPRPLQRPTRPSQRPSYPPHPHLSPPTPPLDGDWYVTHMMSPGSTPSMMVWPDPPRPVSPPPWHNPLRPHSPPSPPHPSWFVHSPAPSPSPHGLQQAVLHALNSSQPTPYSEENIHSPSVADNGLVGSQEVPWGNQDSRHSNSSSTRPDTPFHDGY